MRRVFNLCLLTVLFVLSSISVSAVPADSRPKQIRQKDGTTITVITYGDEFYHYTTTADGILVSSVDGIYQYATVDAEGRITALESAGFQKAASLDRAPEGAERNRQGFVLARLDSSR